MCTFVDKATEYTKYRKLAKGTSPYSEWDVDEIYERQWGAQRRFDEWKMMFMKPLNKFRGYDYKLSSAFMKLDPLG